MRSFLPDYDLVVPRDLPEALKRLDSGEEWRPIAGGTDLMVLLNAGKLPYRKLVSVQQLPELRRINVSENYVEIGAAVTYTQIRQNSVLRSMYHLLCDAASWTGGIANQNRGTLGGNIANASPAADSAPALLIYDAELELASATTSRRMPYRGFHTGYKQVQLRPDELIRTIRLPLAAGLKQQYSRKVGARRAQAISKVCFAASADCTDGIIQDVRIALGSVAPVPLRCDATEAVLRGNALTPAVIARALESIRSEIRPITDIRSTDAYRTQVSVNLLEEFLTELA